MVEEQEGHLLDRGPDPAGDDAPVRLAPRVFNVPLSMITGSSSPPAGAAR
jgi:hypothetical protein